MRLQDIIDLAKYSELSSTAIKDNNDAIILFINAGMLEIYKRFPVKVNEHIVTLSDDTTLYSLPTDFMYALEAFGEAQENSVGESTELSINEPEDPYGIFIPNTKQVQVPLSNTGYFISIMYVAKPTYYTDDDLAEEIDLPETLIEPLLHYIGYKAHLGIRSDGQSDNNAHYMRFERSCDKARELGVAYPLDSMSMINRLGDRNFA